MLLLSPSEKTQAAGTEHTFVDVSVSDWYAETVCYVFDNNLMTGTTPTTFEPLSNLNRAMFVTVLGRMEGIDEEAYPGSSFLDVPTGQWHSAYVEWAAKNGVVNGYENGNFGPNDPVTREQMATMIARYVEAKQLTLIDTEDAVIGFGDRQSIQCRPADGVRLPLRRHMTKYAFI